MIAANKPPAAATAVVHINLLQRSGPSNATAWALGALLVASLLGLGVQHGRLKGEAMAAEQARDAVAAQVQAAQARLGAVVSPAERAQAQALRGEIDALRRQATELQAVVDGLKTASGGRQEEFERPLLAVAALNEPGLWLTAVTVSDGGRAVELQGEATQGAAVMHFAQRANESLRPLALRLNTLEMQPAAAANNGAAGGATGVSFRLR